MSTSAAAASIVKNDCTLYVDAKIREFCTLQKTWLEQELHEEQDEAEAAALNSNSSKTKKTSQEEQQEAAEGRAARVLGHLEAAEISVGLYGRTVVQLVKAATTARGSSSTSSTAVVATGGDVATATNTATNNNKDRNNDLLPAHRFTTGDEVEIRSKSGGTSGGNINSVSTGGVVTAVTDTSISVALFSGRRGGKSQQQQNGGGGASSSSKRNTNNSAASGENNDDDHTGGLGNPPYALLPTSSIEVYRKLVAALNELEKHGVNHPTAGHVVQALFQQPQSDDDVVFSTVKASSTCRNDSSSGLDESQLEAIDFCLQNQRPVALIHGPPGTGKTTTIVELIRRAVLQHGMKVLVAAPSNVAVDNVLSRLVTKNSSSTSTVPITDPGDDVHGDDDNDMLQEENKNKPKRNSRESKIKKNKKLRLVRLGHPARLQAHILPYSLEALVQSSDGTEVVADARQELQSLLRILSSSNNKKTKSGSGGENHYAKKAAAYREVKLLRKEIRQREEQVVQELLHQADVVLATCVGAANRLLGNANGTTKKSDNKSNVSFDLVVIDEAAQALETACWIPALRVGPSGKLVLAGDHWQLPPTIKSHVPQVVQGLGKTMFERLMELYGDDLSAAAAAAKKNQNAAKDDASNDAEKSSKNKVHSLGRVSRMLRTQYRMHQKISDWSSNALYGGQLLTHKSVASRTLAQLSAGNNDKRDDNNRIDDDDHDDDGVSTTALLLIDTAGCAMYERKNEAGSRSNEMEGRIVAQHVRKLLALGVQEEQIAVITPYNGQVELLRMLLLPEAPKLEIRSVDGFQGGEREAVVLSLVRSSERGGMDGIGFLRDDRRLNVAVTRAKRHCCVVCDSETVSQSSFVQGLVQWMEEHGESRSALEYLSSEGNKELQIQSDLALAEQEMHRLMKAVAPPPTKGKESVSRKKADFQKKPPSASKAEEEEKRKGILDQVRAFAEKGPPGDEMTLNAELSSYDRMFVHELAEKLCIGHQSQGVEGVDRRIVLSIPHKASTATKMGPQAASESHPVTSLSAPSDNASHHVDGVIDSVEDTDEDTKNKGTPSSFAALNDSDTESEAEEAANDESESSPEPTMNSLLGNLAMARARRQRQATKAAGTAATTAKPKAKKKKGQKLGGGGSAQKEQAVSKDDGMDELDDIAFLDAQIDKVQNAHGRKFDAKGKAYRTVINGILSPTQRPEPERKRDAKSSAALQAKLKNAEDSRKAKPKQKK